MSYSLYDRKFIIVIVLALILGKNTRPIHGIYVLTENQDNSEKHLMTISTNWTQIDDGLWGPLYEDWILTNSGNRDKKVLQQQQQIIEGGPPKIRPSKVVNGRPQKQQTTLSDNELHLLNAIEKLVFRVDSLQKRIRRLEEVIYYIMAGNRIDTVAPPPCPDNFTRISNKCYRFSSLAGRELDWKAASRQCKKWSGAILIEFETLQENQDVVNYVRQMPHLWGKDYWVGGLNPGLLWIWSNTARPVADNGTMVKGDGRCLRLVYSSDTKTYSYRGTDCSVRYSFICELPDDGKISNEIQRIGRARNILALEDIHE